MSRLGIRPPHGARGGALHSNECAPLSSALPLRQIVKFLALCLDIVGQKRYAANE
jgi:hypothetical protein